MKKKLTYISLLSSLLVALSFVLSSCGGGGLQLSEGGIGGTGITMGRISNLNGFTVNGVNFDVSTSLFSRDGKSNNTGVADFNIGEVVTVIGVVDDDGFSGVAESVSFVNTVEGPITLLETATKLEVLGQAVSTDVNTAFYNFNSLADLQEGDIIEVSGFFDTDGLIQASSLKLQTESSEFEARGFIQNLDVSRQIFSINNLLVDFSKAEFENITIDQLENGIFIEAEGKTFENGILIAREIELEEDDEIKPGTDVELEGLVTRFASIFDFDVNGQAVSTNEKTEFENDAQDALALNVKVEVKGRIDAQGVLVAEKVELEERN